MILVDGTCIIMTYNTNAELISDGDTVHPQFVDLPIGFGRTKKFAYTTSVTNPIAFVMDVNGFRGPNSEERNGKKMDIRSFRGAKFAKGCDAKVNGQCIVALGASTAINATQDEYKKYDSTCASDTSWWCKENHWVGAKLACEQKGMTLPNKDTLLAIYNSHTPGLPISGVFWSNSQSSNSEMCAVAISTDGTIIDANKAMNSHIQVLCVD